MTGRGFRGPCEEARARIRPGQALVLAFLVLGVLLALAPTAGATQYQRPFVEEFGSTERPGFNLPEAIVVDQANGDVLVGDSGGPERLRLTVSATAGTFRLSLEGKTTSDLPYDITSSELQTAFADLTGYFVNIGGNATNQSPFRLDFIGNPERDVGPLSCEDGATALSGGSGCSVTKLADGKAKGLYRFHADGTPAPFSALGSNLIDGKAGPGGKSCAEEPASCDQTPQNEVSIGRGQISIDPVTGNIYLAQPEDHLVDIFSSDGGYISQLTAVGSSKFGDPCGVVVDPDGAVYISQSSTSISKFVASGGGPPVNTDGSVLINNAGFEGTCQMALGSGPSSGSLFIVNGELGGNPGPRTLKIDTQTGDVSVFANGYSKYLAVDPSNGNPLVAPREKTVKDEDPNPISTGEPNELVEFDGSLGSTEAVLSRVVAESAERILGVATDSAGKVYVLPKEDDAHILVYSNQPAVVPTVTVDAATEVTSSAARLAGTVNPEETTVEKCFFEWGPDSPYNGSPSWSNTTPCEETVPSDSSTHTVTATISGLAPNGVGYSFRLAASNENGTERSPRETLASASTVQTDSATVTGIDAAILNGSLRPEGSQYTDCFFEWGPTSSFGFMHTVPCTPEAGEIPDDTGAYPVTATLSGLREATTYRFRVQATNGEGTLIGEEETFETWGPPQIEKLRARDASQNAATIEAEVDPSGFETSYWFEWGPTPSYGYRVPADPDTVGSGEVPVRVQARVDGLSSGSEYHFRVVAASSHNSSASDDQIFETLNSCGLPEDRCFELVSRRDAGPVGIPGEATSPPDIKYQAASAWSGLAYPVEQGYPDSSKGYIVVYRGTRGGGGWSSAQVSTPIAARLETTGTASESGKTQWLANDLACGFGTANYALTDDPGPQLIVERGGGGIFYRLDPGGGYTAVPRFPAEQALSGFQSFVGASQDCGKVAFTSTARYPGIPAPGQQRLYEWEDGVVRNAGVVPGPSGEVAVEAGGVDFNAVSLDGSRVFFTATRQTSDNSEEIGKTGIFVRENGTTTRDLSLSETATPASEVDFQYAAADGSRVFFTAVAGLTAESSPKGTDLYEYDLETDTLNDLSVLNAPDGAEVTGFVGASEDGSHVYFTARGQFIAGHGKTFEQNSKASTQSLYGVHDGEVSFVAPIEESSVENGFEGWIVGPGQGWTSRVSPDGRYLLFQTTGNVTGYQSGGAYEAYLYDAHDGSEGTICVSCRPDGQPSVASHFVPVLAPVLAERASNPLHPTQFLSEGENGPQVYFSSLDALAPGAVEGQNNVYEWSHGQVFRLVSAPAGQQTVPRSGFYAAYRGASADGTDVFLTTPETLNWEDGDQRLSIYDARVGGGFPEPPPPPAPCDAGSEGSCRGPSQGSPPAPAPASATFSGPGNEKPAKGKKKHKKHRHKKGKHKKTKRAGTERRAGK